MRKIDIENIIKLYNDSDIITIDYILKNVKLTNEQRENMNKWLDLNLNDLDSEDYYRQREKTLNSLNFYYNDFKNDFGNENDLLKYGK